METHRLQLWPSGNGVEYKGDPHGPTLRIRNKNGRWRTPESGETAAIKTEVFARALLEREVLACQSSLVDELMKADTRIDGFDTEKLENLYPDPSDWNADKCLEWLGDMGIDNRPEVDPTNDPEEYLDELRQLVTNNAEPAEVYEWWLVSGHLCRHLRDIGEVVLDNDYGRWWGRTCTGQELIMDGTLQKVAAIF